jgi:hypothetical protein
MVGLVRGNLEWRRGLRGVGRQLVGWRLGGEGRAGALRALAFALQAVALALLWRAFGSLP